MRKAKNWREYFHKDLEEITKDQNPKSEVSFETYLFEEYGKRYRLPGELPRKVFISYGLEMAGFKKRKRKKTVVTLTQYSLF